MNLDGHAMAPLAAPNVVNILLVDDEVRNLDVLESILTSPDYHLVKARTAEEALMTLLEGTFAVMVLDIQMPGTNGIELAHLIKQRKRTQHIPIIFLTAYFQEDKDVLQGYEVGAVDYLTKPVDARILKSKIAVFVELFQKNRELTVLNTALENEVAQRVSAEQALRQVNAELEDRVQERMASHAELAREKEAQSRLYDATLSSISDLAYTFDLEGNWIYANRPLLELWGKTLLEIRGKSFLELGYPVELAQLLKEQIKKVITTQKPVKGETFYSSVKGVEDYHEYIFSPVFADDGNVVAVCGTTRITTERKRAEKEIELARDQAVAASRAKDDFLAALSHELRTPLNPVLLLASDAAENSKLPPEIRTQFAIIRNNVELEARLIDDLLDLTRITNGKLSLNLDGLDVHEILQRAMAIVRSDLNEKQIKLTIQLTAGNSAMTGDVVRLQQIFWNVLKNAVKFTPPGGQITIKTHTSPAKDKILVEITDTGIGLTAEETEHIFKAFSQGEHAANKNIHRFGGLGLGLSISRMLVELHSGLIYAKSAGRGQGATFTVELPLSKAKGETASPNLSHAKTTTNISVFGKTKAETRILLVEDHEATRTALIYLLTRQQYQVSAATSIAEARRLARQEKFDLVLSDIGLPDGDGHTLMAELRAEFGLKGIALTGYGMEQDVARSQGSGFVAHLTKPIRMENLKKVLREELQFIGDD